MKVYVAEVWDSELGINLVTAVCSTAVKAQRANHKYVEEHGLKPVLLDWDDDDDASIEWYNSNPDDRSFTCTVKEMVLDVVG